MKRKITALFLAALTLLTLSTAALADDAALGAYHVQSKTGYTLRVDGVESDGGFYLGADTFTLTLKTAPAEQTLVYLVEGSGLPTEQNLQYIDQSGTDTTFTLKPKGLEADKIYRVYVSTASKEPTEAASFSYGKKPTYTLGDVNEDGTINVLDASALLNYLVDKRTFTENNRLAADVANPKGTLNVLDASRLLNYLVDKGTFD